MSARSSTAPLRLGARTSPLARAQVDQVAALAGRARHATTFVGVTTTGDVDQRQLTEIGGTGVFASAVRDALRRGEIDVAVHSLKDLPTRRRAGAGDARGAGPRGHPRRAGRDAGWTT